MEASDGNTADFYDGALLSLATDLVERMMPSFDSTTGLPYGSVNLRHDGSGSEISRLNSRLNSDISAILFKYNLTEISVAFQAKPDKC